MRSGLNDSPVAIVTGASRGIGAATARLFGKGGYRVVAAGRDREGLERVVAEIIDAGGVAMAHGCDVGEEAEVDRLFTDGVARFGGVDVVINNAGIIARAPIEALGVDAFDRVMRVNARGTFLCARAAFRCMIAEGRGGSIVNVASLSGVAGVEKFPGYAAYVASKFAVVGLTEALAVEGRAHRIRVNAVSPGAVDTDLLRHADPSLRAAASPDDIARTIVFLATDPIVTGSNLAIFCNG